MKKLILVLGAALIATNVSAKMVTQHKKTINDDATSFAEIVCGDVKRLSKHLFIRQQYERSQFSDQFLDNLEREFGSHFNALERHAKTIVVINESKQGKTEQEELSKCKRDVLLFTLQNVL
ncbi:MULTISPECIES: hypothetical protein [Vibrio]|uniref:hypothetical protein n=1 Tax=Vibrio TaxID=662 RepID=UPI00078BC4A6|nr:MULTISPECIES: hypothetical protein [Vibrio]BAU70994.1 hypothetical protein [Vibrio sp. 04Ya108]BBM67745.1 hypothetical protein VA249_43910 [Vibrio alfacsensis]BCN26917.1 hypothetical protein VYA_41090 [Vibrio alfacsensis]